MRIDAIVLNASPLITLFRSGQADLLPLLFKHIVVPEAVWQEVMMGEREDAAARELSKQRSAGPGVPACRRKRHPARCHVTVHFTMH